MLVVLHSGQSGVERGAHYAAVAMGLPVAGMMSSAQRDEYGPLPENVRCYLSICPERGPRAAARATLATASALLLVCACQVGVERESTVYWIVRAARARELPYLIIDSTTPPWRVHAWLRDLTCMMGELPRVFVTGPRETRWHEGEAVTRRLMRGLRPIEVVP